MSPEELLGHAAERAGQEKEVDGAVRASWSALHTDRGDAQAVAFRAWARTVRGHEGDIPRLGDILRRSCRTPDGVAQTLRDAVNTVAFLPALSDVDRAHELRDLRRRLREAQDAAHAAHEVAEAALRTAHTAGSTDADVQRQIEHDRHQHWLALRQQRWHELGFNTVMSVVFPPKRLKSPLLGDLFEADAEWIARADLERALNAGRRHAVIDREFGARWEPSRPLPEVPLAAPVADPFDALLDAVLTADGLAVLDELARDPAWAPEHEALAALRRLELGTEQAA